MPLDLVIPDLLLPPEAPAELRAVRLPRLERWLARSDLARAPLRGVHAVVAEAFSLATPAPIAALTLAADDEPRPGVWLRADPVHLRLAQDAVALHDASVLDVTRDEAAALVGALASHFAADGFEFVAPTPARWYVRVPAAEMPRTTPLADALGRNVFGLLPRGDGKVNWPSALTEVQMTFAAHPVNQRRESESRPAINSVWFWGEGELPASLPSPYALILGDSLAQGLARVSGTRGAAPPAGLDAVDAVRDGESVLVVLDDLAVPLHQGDIAAWQAAAERLDEQWFARIGDALERFGRVRVILPGATDTRIATVTASARWRWFRPRKALATHA